ncbi:MAG: cyclic nucleotide-binding domain-containing protein [Thermoanaerobaculia bacterium]
MAAPTDFTERLQRAARAAEKARLTAEADDLYRLGFEVEHYVRANGHPGRDAALARIARAMKNAAAAADLAARAQDHLLLGILHLESNDLDAARRELDTCKAENPFDAEGAFWRGKLNFLEHRLPEALADFLDAEWLSPDPAAPVPPQLRAVAALLDLSRDRLAAAAHEAWKRLSEEAIGSGCDFPEGKRTEKIVEKICGGENAAPPGETIERAAKLRSLSNLAELDDGSLFEIAGLAKVRRARRGEHVFRAQDPAPDFFLVVEGRVELERVTPAGPQTLGEAATGEFFGVAESLLSARRLAEAVATEDSLMFSFEADRIFERAASAPLSLRLVRELGRTLRTLNEMFKTFFPSAAAPDAIAAPTKGGDIKIPSQEKARILSREGLAPEDLVLFATFSAEQTFPEGSVIFREGDPGPCFYVVAGGKVRISRRLPGAGEEALAILGPGAIFGETSAFDPEQPARSADAIAHEDCTLLALDRNVLDRLRRSAPESGAALSAVLCREAARRVVDTSERLVHWRVMAGPF